MYLQEYLKIIHAVDESIEHLFTLKAGEHIDVSDLYKMYYSTKVDKDNIKCFIELIGYMLDSNPSTKDVFMCSTDSINFEAQCFDINNFTIDIYAAYNSRANIENNPDIPLGEQIYRRRGTTTRLINKYVQSLFKNPNQDIIVHDYIYDPEYNGITEKSDFRFNKYIIDGIIKKINDIIIYKGNKYCEKLMTVKREDFSYDINEGTMNYHPNADTLKLDMEYKHHIAEQKSKQVSKCIDDPFARFERFEHIMNKYKEDIKYTSVGDIIVSDNKTKNQYPVSGIDFWKPAIPSGEANCVIPESDTNCVIYNEKEMMI